MYLLDTNVISTISPRARHASGEVVARWIAANSRLLYLSVVTIAEIEDGIAKSARNGATTRARDLAEWLEALLHYYGERVLPLNTEVARVAGKLMDRARGAGISPGFEDIAIAALAAHHGLTILTRNVKDFSPLGVPLLNPFDEDALL
jgi:predicted nucleic acid-binding protein